MPALSRMTRPDSGIRVSTPRPQGLGNCKGAKIVPKKEFACLPRRAGAVLIEGLGLGLLGCKS